MRPEQRSGLPAALSALSDGFDGSDPSQAPQAPQGGEGAGPAAETLAAAIAAVADALTEGVALSRGGRILWANLRLGELAALASGEELEGLCLSELFPEGDLPEPGEAGRPSGGSLCRLQRIGAGRASADDRTRTVVVRGVHLDAVLGGPSTRGPARATPPAGAEPAQSRRAGPGRDDAPGGRDAPGRAGDPGADEERDEAVESVESVVWIVEDRSHVYGLEEELLRSGRDLAARNRELERLRERTRRESQEREELLTVVAHELRTPTTVIQGYNKLLLSERVGSLTDEQRRFLEESTRSCQRLGAFIGNLLEAARLVEADAPLEVSESGLDALVETVVRHLEPLLGERDLAVDVRIDPAAARARFDPVRIEQVLTNLLSNAIKYAPASSRIEVTTRRVGAEGAGRSFVETAVADQGPGIDPADRERIFLPYVRTEASRGAGGLGLGLALCRRLVEAHGGAIRVEPRPGGGSRFAFTLPAAHGAAAGPVAPDGTPPAAGAAASREDA